MHFDQLKELLDSKYALYNNNHFIESDPILIPHLFSKKQDIEIAGLFAAVLAWGQRKTIIDKCKHLMELMENSPFNFIKDHTDNDLKKLLHFVHRTFNSTDLLYFVEFLKFHYSKYDSLQDAFLISNDSNENIKRNLINFKKYFFSIEDHPVRTNKHISSPDSNSACKRINMYLRWMVRKDKMGVDFGIWDQIFPSQLICPCDVHVEKTAHVLGLSKRPKADWKMAEEITDFLKTLDPEDPVKYDFALFGMGIEKYFN
jgi:uncharacterized protein (TIGR02757 family)